MSVWYDGHEVHGSLDSETREVDMSDTIDRIQRLRKLRERSAQMDWMAADNDRREQEEVLDKLDERVRRAHFHTNQSGVAQKRVYDAFLVEMDRRKKREGEILKGFESDVEEKMDEMREKAMERQIIDAVAEHRQEEQRIEDRRREGKVLSDHTTVRWGHERSKEESEKP